MTKRDSSGEPEEFRATLVEHLEELRTRLVRIIQLIVGGWVIGWFLQKPVYDTFNNVAAVGIRNAGIDPDRYKEAFTHFTQMFIFQMQFSFIIGLVLALPFVLTQLWGFVAPGLRETEKRPLKRLAPVSILLFFTGVAFCWFCLPAAVAWFVSYLDNFPGAVLNQQPGSMVLFMVKIMLAFGIGFQLPVIVYGLGAIGLLSAQTLAKHWRHGTVFVFFLSAILTPSNDPLTMLMMAIPLSILFMISVWAVKIVQRKKVKVIENPDYVEDAPDEREEDEE
ncbi:MAG: twin-arginine translocase subunit TatC [Chlorobia bacterium]|nr:twin-arginine translocase subunit TatC [Fimbriimonadaceae bacterium]